MLPYFPKCLVSLGRSWQGLSRTSGSRSHSLPTELSGCLAECILITTKRYGQMRCIGVGEYGLGVMGICAVHGSCEGSATLHPAIE